MAVPLNREALVPVLERMTYGIYVLTTAAADSRHAMVVSWVTQVSWEPLRVGVGIRKSRHAHGLILRGGNFALNLLDRDHPPDLDRIKTSGASGILEHATGVSGAPILSGCLGYLDCTLHLTFDAGDHTFFVGNVVGGALCREAAALSTLDYGRATYLGRR